MKKVLLFISIFIIQYKSIGQTIYANLNLIGGNNEMYTLDLSNNTFNLEFSYVNLWSSADFAIAPDGTFYCTGQGKLFEIDQVNSTVIFLAQLASNAPKSLVCGNDNKLYALDGNGTLVSYNIATQQINTIIDFGFSTPGDLTFYKGNLVFQNATTNHIVAYNLDTQTIKTVICSIFDDNCLGLWGITTVFDDCNNERLIASDNENNFYELDIENQVMTNLNINVDFINDHNIFFGLASTTEHLASNCTSIDFNEITCSIVPECDPSLGNQDYQNNTSNISIYPNPAEDIIYFNLNNKTKIKYIEIYNLSGKLIKRINNIIENNININYLNRGLYFLKISINNNIKYFKIIHT